MARLVSSLLCCFPPQDNLLHIVSLHPVVHTAGGNPAMDQHPSQAGGGGGGREQ